MHEPHVPIYQGPYIKARTSGPVYQGSYIKARISRPIQVILLITEARRLPLDRQPLIPFLACHRINSLSDAQLPFPSGKGDSRSYRLAMHRQEFSLRQYPVGAPRLLCTRARIANLAAIPHIPYDMCETDSPCASRDHERLRSARCHAATYGGIGAAWLEASPRQSRRHRRPFRGAPFAGHESRLRGTRIFTKMETAVVILNSAVGLGF